MFKTYFIISVAAITRQVINATTPKLIPINELINLA